MRSPCVSNARGSFRIRIGPIWLIAIIQNVNKHVTGLRGCIGAIGSHLATYTGCVFGYDLTKCIALYSDPLSGFDFVIQIDQQLDKSTAVSEYSVSAITYKDTRILAGPPHWTCNDAVVLQHIHCPLHEQRDHVVIENARRSNFWRECWNACIDKGARQETWIGRIVENLVDGIKLSHSPNLGQVHASKMKRTHVHARRRRMEIYSVIGVWPKKPVEQHPCVP